MITLMFALTACGSMDDKDNMSGNMSHDKEMDSMGNDKMMKDDMKKDKMMSDKM